MNTPELKYFINKNKELFWHTSSEKIDNISLDFLVEQILNYGDKDAIKELFNILGIEKVAHIFHRNINDSERKKNNYFELIRNYFTLYFNRHAPIDTLKKAN